MSPAKSKAQLLAYTAGIIDGEGSIGIHWHKSKSKNSPGYYGLRVAVGNTSEWLIQFLKFNFGGSIIISHRLPLRWKDAWHWTVYNRQACQFLELILPYLYLKFPQAELGIAFQRGKRQKITNRIAGSGKGNKPMSESDFALEQAQAILMAKLNHKGKEDANVSSRK